MLINGIILAISTCDTLRPPDTLFKPYTNSVRDTKYHNCMKTVVLEHNVPFDRGFC